ncbi:MAG: HAD family phosphatase [Succinatimonas hippei]|nr:HAD family phosphatase [Succinatimonas hippei]
MAIKNVIFDLGGVLIDWNPVYVYKSVFHDEAKLKYFLENVCTSEWNAQMDRGRSFDECIKELQDKFPDYKNEIAMWKTRWVDMLQGSITQGVELFNAVKKSGKYTCYALTNWSAETFPTAFKLFPFLNDFEGIVVSGEEKMTKPDKGLYLTLFERYHLNPEECLYIDDNDDNIKTGKSRGMVTISFKDPEEGYKKAMKRLGLHEA